MKFKEHILPCFILLGFALFAIYLCFPSSSEMTEGNVLNTVKAQPKDSVQIMKEARAYSDLKKSYDEIEQFYWYKNSYFTHYINRDGISLYIGHHKGSSKPFMRLKITCFTTRFFGMNHIVLHYDGHSMDLPIDYFKDRKFESDGYGCQEWVDILIENNYISFLEGMAKSNNATIRFKSNTSSRDYKVTEKEKKGIEQVILGYNHFFNN